jgi:hypothetical protein
MKVIEVRLHDSPVGSCQTQARVSQLEDGQWVIFVRDYTNTRDLARVVIQECAHQSAAEEQRGHWRCLACGKTWNEVAPAVEYTFSATKADFR